MLADDSPGPLNNGAEEQSIELFKVGVTSAPQGSPDVQTNLAQPRSWTDKRILLLDGNLESRNSRTKALTDRGAHVDCVGTGADARSLWKPGSHELVMIELRNAAADIEAFYAYAHAAFRNQRFGFYLTAPPYVTGSYREYEATRENEIGRSPKNASAFAGDAVPRPYQPGLPEAARQIAAIRRLVRPSAVCNVARVRPVSVSDAMKIAQRVLGGSADTARGAGEPQC